MCLLNLNRRKAKGIAPLFLASMVMVACSNQQIPPPAVNIQKTDLQNSSYYLQQLQESNQFNKSSWQILAIRALIDEGQENQADNLLKNVAVHDLDRAQLAEYQLAGALLKLKNKQWAEAQQDLQQITLQDLSTAQKKRYYEMYIASANTKQSPDLSLLRAYVALQPLLSGDAAKQNINETWQTLLHIPADKTDSYTINADEYILAGWFDLLNLYNHYQGNQDQLIPALDYWKGRYPEHPAAITPPSNLIQALPVNHPSQAQVALLLPMTGSGALFSQAIVEGIEDARNQRHTVTDNTVSQSDNTKTGIEGTASRENLADNHGASDNSLADSHGLNADQSAKSENANSPSDSSSHDSLHVNVAGRIDPAQQVMPASSPSSSTSAVPSLPALKIYDTNAQPVDQLLEQAKNDGANVIIGPLLKKDVDKLASIDASMDILALNMPDSQVDNAHICYLSLSPEDEARDAARHIWAEGKRQPLIFTPSTDLGRRTVIAFTREWQYLGGETVRQQSFGSKDDLTRLMGSRNGIALNGLPVVLPNDNADHSSPDTPAPGPVISSTDPSDKPDAIYIVATQSELGLLKPLLTLSTGSNSGIRFYASSVSAQAGAGTDFRFEMEGMEYSDIPLLSGGDLSGIQPIIQKFNNDYKLVRLYALGVDAWMLANQFSSLRQGTSSFKGDTGQLSIGEHCRVNRTLSWSRYEQGKVVPAS